jgi:uncharacterized protein YecE (DUF72 family)
VKAIKTNTGEVSAVPSDDKRTQSPIRLGCAGWSYKEWIGPLYDPDKSMLQQYSSIFDTVEIDSSFYKFPERGTVLGMARYTPRGFAFSAKMNKKFTHELRLKLDENAQTELDSFCELFDPLLSQDKLACMLVQLPPSLKRDDGLLEEFLALLPKRIDYVVEFRHPSWLESSTWTTLSKYQAAYCVVDEPLLPPEIHVTSDVGYIRWHGRGQGLWYDYRYTRDQLTDWLPKIEEVRSNTKQTIGVFNNHFHGYAPENCIQVMEMLGLASEKHETVLKRIQDHIEGRGSPTDSEKVTLDRFTGT